MKSALAPLAEDFQVLYFDLRGYGRSDHGSAEFWNLRTWADDLRRLCDALGLSKPVVLGSSFGGFVVLTYAALFPDHPGGVILAARPGVTGTSSASSRHSAASAAPKQPGARHTIFRDRPDLAFPAVKNFVSQIGESQRVRLGPV